MSAMALFCACAWAQDAAKDIGKEAGKETEQVLPRKVSVDTVGDGKPHRFEYYDAKGVIIKVEYDKAGDGIIDESIEYRDGKPFKSWKDTKRRGKPDIWIEYQ
jgi:hypothetical protein